MKIALNMALEYGFEYNALNMTFDVRILGRYR